MVDSGKAKEVDPVCCSRESVKTRTREGLVENPRSRGAHVGGAGRRNRSRTPPGI